MLVLLICALNLCVKLTNKFGWGIKKKQEIENKIKKGKKKRERKLLRLGRIASAE